MKTKTTRRIWDKEKLELMLILVNKMYPDKPIKSIKRLQAIILNEEKLRGESAEQHNKEFNQ